jgi:hypothetical protein
MTSCCPPSLSLQGRDQDVVDRRTVLRGKLADSEGQHLSDDEQLDLAPLPDQTRLSGCVLPPPSFLPPLSLPPRAAGMTYVLT